MEWYYAEAGQRVGPISEAEFRGLFAAGKVGPENLVWRAGMPGWQQLGSLAEWSALSVPNPRICTQCQREFAPEDLLEFESARVCPECKEQFFQRLREQGAEPAIQTWKRYGGFWIRVLARLIDGAILSAFSILLVFVWEAAMRRVILNPTGASRYEMTAFVAGIGLIYLLAIGVSIAYEAWFLSHRGATPGKLAVGLRVIRSNGDTLTKGRATGRAFAYLLSSMIPLAIAFIMAGIDEEKRALHDRICDTRVVYKHD